MAICIAASINILSSAEFGLESLNPIAATAKYKLHIVRHRKYQKTQNSAVIRIKQCIRFTEIMKDNLDICKDYSGWWFEIKQNQVKIKLKRQGKTLN